MTLKWEKPAPALVDFFTEKTTGVPCEHRVMFGYPCCFINSNMFIGLFKQLIIVRLAEKDRDVALNKHRQVTLFESMPGRVMKEYVALSETVYRNEEVFADLVSKSLKHVSSLPKKASKTKTKKRKK